jgi:hypothetical protein
MHRFLESEGAGPTATQFDPIVCCEKPGHAGAVPPRLAKAH